MFWTLAACLRPARPRSAWATITTMFSAVPVAAATSRTAGRQRHLVDRPADSGLSLEAPPSLSGTGEGTLDFGGGAEDDFLLKPLDEGGDEDSESGSQVIMLDSEGAFDEKSSTLIADSLPGMPGGMNMDFGSPLGGGALVVVCRAEWRLLHKP